jgi:hypothetical protein
MTSVAAPITTMREKFTLHPLLVAFGFVFIAKDRLHRGRYRRRNSVHFSLHFIFSDGDCAL